jgi:tetratricopeptide (TPR) repeat protein
VNARDFLDRFEATGDEQAYGEAKRRYVAALAETPDDATLLHDFGYLQECHGRRALEAAVACYQRAIAYEPEAEKVRHQLIHAQRALGRSDEAVALYERRFAERHNAPADYRCLAHAYLAAGRYEDAERVVRAGLELAPGDAHLVELRGEVFARTGRAGEALACWRRAVELDPENLSPLYSTAFLLERQDRLAEAVSAWSEIIGWCEQRGNALDAEWPRRETVRLEAELSSRERGGRSPSVDRRGAGG